MRIARSTARAALLLTAAVTFLAGVLLATSLSEKALATHEPADHVAAAGATVVEVGPTEDVVLMREQIRTASPTDLVLEVSAECGVFFRWQESSGVDVDRLRGAVRIWIEIDGVPVPVSSDDTDGRVRFCERFFDRRAVAQTGSEVVSSDQVTASSFTWVRLATGTGLHDVVVKAEIREQPAGVGAIVSGVVAKRTLVVRPVKMPVDQTVDPVTP